MRLTDAQWAVVQPFLPKPSQRADGRGRPRQDDRAILEAILWILRTGAQWSELPAHFPPKSTCHDRFQAWNRAGVLTEILRALAEDLRVRSGIDLAECFIDATFASAKKGAPPSATASVVRAPNAWQGQTDGLPIAIHGASATPTKSRWLQPRLRIGSPEEPRSTSLAMALTTAMGSMRSSQNLASR